jgi:hypothetical protein
MWSRVVEIMLGCWLLVSPFIFGHPESQTAWWVNDLACGTAAIAFGLLSFWKPTELAHLLTIAVGLWLIGFAYSHLGETPAPAVQNQVLIGWLLLMFAIVPNYASRPPAEYDRKFRELVGG